ncbi:hypothetical protein HZB07_03455 [Candidatus Saganbacteria bacterium]|nr:hypothetical protein [Candidatus Saganbacteria bacterium]
MFTVINCFKFLATLSLMMVWLISAVLADTGYLTTYSHHIYKGELEMMIMTDLTSPSKINHEEGGQGQYLSQMIELEYAPTDRLALEFMAEGFRDLETGVGRFTGYRYEARFNPFVQKLPLNPTLYVEFEDLDPATRYKMEVSGWVVPPYVEAAGSEEGREKIVETRLILSNDFGPWNCSFNWINETDLRNGVTAFGYATGILYTLENKSEDQMEHHGHSMAKTGGFFAPISMGLELVGALGDTKSFGLVTPRQQHYLQPSIMLQAGENAMLSAGFMIGLTEVSDDIVRLNWGWVL